MSVKAGDVFWKCVNRARDLMARTAQPFAPQPPRRIPPGLLDAYTLNGRIPVKYRYFNNCYPQVLPRVYYPGRIDEFLKRVARRENFYYQQTSEWLYRALEKYSIRGQTVAVMGSALPACESFCLFFGGIPTSVEYNKVISRDPRIRAMTVAEYEKAPFAFDAAFSISSFEHDGLGRYGDPLDPDGDLKAMEKMKRTVRSGGLFFLAVPVGKDMLVWNAHRIYGRIRLPLLLRGWELVETFGLEDSDYQRDEERHVQPVLVLRSSA